MNENYQHIPAEQVGQFWSCNACGALVLDLATHDEWHAQITAHAHVVESFETLTDAGIHQWTGGMRQP